MAVVSPIPVIPQHINPRRYRDIRSPGMMASRGEIVEEPLVQVVVDKVYVAVGKDLNESKSTLLWALHKSEGRRICILHVHNPAQRIPCMGTKFSVSQLEEHLVRAHREIEKQDMNKLLCDYSKICEQAGVRAEVLHIEMDSIEKGIVELISQHGIRMLVMGAAAGKHYSKKMMEPKSKKAIYVHLQAPIFCHIWFICKGNLVHTREGRPGVGMQVACLPQQASANYETGQSSSLRSHSVIQRSNEHLNLDSSSPGSRKVRFGTKLLSLSPECSQGATPRTSLKTEGSFSDSERMSKRSVSLSSRPSSSSSFDIADYLTPALGHTEGDPHCHSSPPCVLDSDMDDEIYGQLNQAIAEADNSRREAFEESQRRRKAEKDAIDAFRRAKAAENLYAGELRKKKEIEEAVSRGKEELEKLKHQVDELMEELCISREQKLSLESKIAKSNQMVQELEQKMFSAVELLQKYKKERDELQLERDNALEVAEELRKKQAEAALNGFMPRFFSEFYFSEIEEATNNFDPSLKIGEGGYGSIYRGFLRQTEVAIKMLNSHSLQGPSEFQQEVNILSKLRHPNLVTLIGACPEAWVLAYEYLPNGSLEDRLNCRDNTPPLSWQTRIRIATELCSVLIFLHSCNPYNVVHGDIKPANVLLDANYVSKLSDFGICRVITRDEFSANNTTLCCRTDPKGTFAYMDPEFLASGELTPKSDVYSFGIILLRLLTGRSALGITKEVQYALDKGNLKNLIDPTAGDWPFVQAKQLAHIAMRCCEMNRRSRPDLASEVLRVLEPMRVSCGASSFRMSSEEHCQIPKYFICPIFQEIMQDPHVAADGYTYELEALRGWLESGHDTSPMTNHKLPHTKLVPNHALRSAVQEWLHQR